MSVRSVSQYSTRELQAAVAALASGQFSTAGVCPSTLGVVENQRPAPVAQVAGQSLASIGLDSLVRVRAANAGAGASTITLALADLAAAMGVRTRLLDAAAPPWSGLLGASVTELGSVTGWRRGQRGQGVVIDRVEKLIKTPMEVPLPLPIEAIDVTFLDVGWSMRELAASGMGLWLTGPFAKVEVLVTRSQPIALSQAEAALGTLADLVADHHVLVVVVGAARWSESQFAAAGPLLRTVHAQGAVAFMPQLSVKALPGLGPEDLPKRLTTPAQRLLEQVIDMAGPLTGRLTGRLTGPITDPIPGLLTATSV
jgi:hypothetical protein